MNRLVVVPVLLLAGFAVPVAVAAPAHAKGATDVVVSGPGIEKVKLGYTRRTDDVDVGSLAEVSGIYLIYGAAMATDDPGLARAELGPRYELTWYQGSSVMAVSHVYPFASQGAWMNIPDEHGGWVRGGPKLEDAMVTLGATRPAGTDLTGPINATEATATDEPAAAAAPSPDDPPSGTSAVTAGVIAALVVLLLAAGAWLVRRRRTPQPVLTLSEPA